MLKCPIALQNIPKSIYEKVDKQIGKLVFFVGNEDDHKIHSHHSQDSIYRVMP